MDQRLKFLPVSITI